MCFPASARIPPPTLRAHTSAEGRHKAPLPWGLCTLPCLPRLLTPCGGKGTGEPNHGLANQILLFFCFGLQAASAHAWGQQLYKRPHSDPGPTDTKPKGAHASLDDEQGEASHPGQAETRPRRRSPPGRKSPAAAVATWPTIAGSSGRCPADDRPRRRSLFGRQSPAAAVALFGRQSPAAAIVHGSGYRPASTRPQAPIWAAAAVATWPTLARGGCCRPDINRPRQRSPPGRQSSAAGRHRRERQEVCRDWHVFYASPRRPAPERRTRSDGAVTARKTNRREGRLVAGGCAWQPRVSRPATAPANDQRVPQRAAA